MTLDIGGAVSPLSEQCCRDDDLGSSWRFACLSKCIALSCLILVILKLSDSIAELADTARNLGIVFKSKMSLTGHVNIICKLYYVFIRDKTPN